MGLDERRWERSAAQEVNVKVIHGLAGVPSLVDDQPIAVLFDALSARHFRGHADEPPDRLVSGRGRRGCTGDVHVGDHQNVGRSLRRDIAKGGDAI